MIPVPLTCNVDNACRFLALCCRFHRQYNALHVHCSWTVWSSLIPAVVTHSGNCIPDSYDIHFRFPKYKPYFLCFPDFLLCLHMSFRPMHDFYLITGDHFQAGEPARRKVHRNKYPAVQYSPDCSVLQDKHTFPPVSLYHTACSDAPSEPCRYP